MGNFKVKVDTPEESKEVQDLLVKMGYHARANWNERNPIHESIQAWADGEFTFSLNHNKVPVGFKEITLPELRAMVNPMKEYLVPQNVGGFMYKKAYESKSIPDSWIEIPEGAEIYIDLGFGNHSFYKDNFKLCWCGVSWENTVHNSMNLEHWNNTPVLWKRHTHPEELPFIDDGPSLNDQYAEIEQVRQTLNERQSQYGSFKDVAHTTQYLLHMLSNDSMSDVQIEALHMICSKLARIANGDPNHVDSWHDIAGYATLVVNGLENK